MNILQFEQQFSYGDVHFCGKLYNEIGLDRLKSIF